jgi:hypothetical protein
MIHRPALTALLALLPLGAAAQAVTYTCNFTQRCVDEGTCEPVNSTYGFRLDLGSGRGAMIAEGSEYPGTAWDSGPTDTFLMINSAGAEMTSIDTVTGAAMYTGHMGFDGIISTYQLSGTCRRSGK